MRALSVRAWPNPARRISIFGSAEIADAFSRVVTIIDALPSAGCV